MTQTTPSAQADATKWIRKQVFYTRLLFVAVVLIAAAVIVFAVTAVNTIQQVYGQFAAISGQVNDLIDDVQDATKDLAVVAENLKEVDWQNLTGNIDQAVQTAQASLTDAQEMMSVGQDALQKMNELDVETMNQAIRDLYAVVQPLAKLFGGSR